MVFWHLLVSWSTWRSWRSSWPEGRGTRRERGEKKKGDEKKESLLFLFNVELGWNVKHDSTFNNHLVNVVWNSDWYCSYFETWNSSGALHLLLAQHSHEGLLSGCKMSKDKIQGQKIITELFLLSAHIRGQNAQCHTLFSDGALHKIYVHVSSII